jgi:hypothetical protein
MRYDDCEMRSNGDGVKPVYQQREQRQKLALENLKRPTAGKLGNLKNFQFFNFRVSGIATGTAQFIEGNYNTSSTFPANATQTVMFGIDGLNGKALYYNIVSLNASMSGIFGTGVERLESPSLISFYLLQNNDSSTSSLGTKIPQPSSLYGNGGGAVDFITDGDVYGAQSIDCDLATENATYYQNNDLRGIRASGLALRRILMQFDASLNTATALLDVTVGVDISSVSTSI